MRRVSQWYNLHNPNRHAKRLPKCERCGRIAGKYRLCDKCQSECRERADLSHEPDCPHAAGWVEVACQCDTIRAMS